MILRSLFWDSKSVNANAKQLIESSVSVNTKVTQPLRRQLANLPEMPPSVATDVSGALSAAIAVLADSVASINQQAQGLRKATARVEKADQVNVELPWYQDAVMWVDGIPTRLEGTGTRRGRFAAGAFSAGGGALEGLAIIGGIPLEISSEVIHQTGGRVSRAVGLDYDIRYRKMYDVPSPTVTYAKGLAYAVSHPGETAKALTHYELFKDGQYSKWAGSVVADGAISVLTGGATRIARTGTSPRPPVTRGERVRIVANAATYGVSDVGLALNRWAQSIRRSHEMQTTLNPKLGYDVEHPLTKADLDAELAFRHDQLKNATNRANKPNSKRPFEQATAIPEQRKLANELTLLTQQRRQMLITFDEVRSEAFGVLFGSGSSVHGAALNRATKPSDDEESSR